MEGRFDDRRRSLRCQRSLNWIKRFSGRGGALNDQAKTEQDES